MSAELLFVTNSTTGRQYLHSLRELLVGARAVDLAISYVKLGGWKLVQKEFRRAGVDAANTRIIATSQLGVTQPQAVEAIQNSGALIRNYVGRRVFHAKVIVAYDRVGAPLGAIVGSANLSESALMHAIECGLRTSDRRVLEELQTWFGSLITDNRQTHAFSDEDLRFLEQSWEASSALRLRQSLGSPAGDGRTPVLRADPESLEDLFVTVTSPIATLNIDQAGSNIRNLHHLLELLHAFPSLSTNPRLAAKQRSDLRLMGFLNHDDTLTALGQEAARSQREVELARLWCEWAARAPDADLNAINSRIPAFKHAADRFWTLREEVRRFFLDNLMQASLRKTLQAVELFCNASPVVSYLKVDDFRRLSQVIDAQRLPSTLRSAKKGYLTNKGGRGWGGDDRRIMLEAWNGVQRLATGRIETQR